MASIDIYSGSSNWIEKVLSNLVEHPFTFDGTRYRCIEAFLQGLKYKVVPDGLNDMSGMECYKYCHKERKWQKDLTLYYKGMPLHRMSSAYSDLLFNAYLSMAEQSKPFLEALRASKPHEITHSMGCKDQTLTILTEREFCDILNEIRDCL